MFTKNLPKKVGLYRHRFVTLRGELKEQLLFVGYTNASSRLLQGDKPNTFMPYKLKCCKPTEYLHADRLTPQEWGGYWEPVEKETNVINTSK